MIFQKSRLFFIIPLLLCKMTNGREKGQKSNRKNFSAIDFIYIRSHFV